MALADIKRDFPLFLILQKPLQTLFWEMNLREKIRKDILSYGQPGR